MSAGWTPGPWYGDGRGAIDNHGGHEDELVVYSPAAPLGLRDICFIPEDDEQDQANAHLIAAAPELYGQLEIAQTDLDLLRRAIEENDPKAELLIRVTDLWKRNDAALRKAQGPSQ